MSEALYRKAYDTAKARAHTAAAQSAVLKAQTAALKAQSAAIRGSGRSPVPLAHKKLNYFSKTLERPPQNPRLKDEGGANVPAILDL